ncbi:ATP-binding protein [Myxococcota bacterium]|nr:ATP-binding protein [Myxococcota bacterium]
MTSGGSVEVLSTQVDLGGLMQVLGENLYSTPAVAIRELVQNAHDACVRRRLEDPAPFAPSIVLVPNLAAGTLTIEDAGAGLTRDEIVEYLATIGAGYTRQLRAKTNDPSLIGAFGLGFLSAYVVAERIVLTTTSYREPSQAFCFRSKSGERYSLEEVAPRPVGTEVVLHLKETFRALADPELLAPLVARYCRLLEVPIHVGDRDTPAVNAEPPPWRVDPKGERPRARAERFELASSFERLFKPLAVMPVPRTRDRGPVGLLWIQDGASYATSDHRNVSVFVHGMLITSDARELLPRWAGFVGGVIESDLLVPTASRETLMEDDEWDATRTALTDALVDGLVALARREPEAWRATLFRHNDGLLGAAIAEPRLFDALADQLTVPTTDGDLRPGALVAKSGGRRIHVMLGQSGGYEEVLFRAQKVPVVLGARFAVLPFLRRWCERKGVTLVELGTSTGDRDLFPPAELDAATRAWLEPRLLAPGQALVATRFSPRELPLLVVPDRDAELKARIESDEADRTIARAALGLARLYTAKVDGGASARLYLNLDAPAVEHVLASQRHPRGDRAVALLKMLAVLLSGPGSGSGAPFLETLAEYGRLVDDVLGDPGARP